MIPGKSAVTREDRMGAFRIGETGISERVP